MDRENSKAIQERLKSIEERLESLEWYRFYEDISRRQAEGLLEPLDEGERRFIRSTSDGWLKVIIGGAETTIPSGLEVRLTRTASGRDYGVIIEGVQKGIAFNVTAGNLVKSYERVSDLILKSRLKSGGEVVGEARYDRDVTLIYSEGGRAQSAGPFHSKTHPSNPPPSGRTDIEIPDFPHALGGTYRPHGTVWFRIGHSGDFYVHAGRISAGCVTCDPSTWSEIYKIMHKARKGDARSIGVLDFV